MRLAEFLGVDIPIVQAPMAGVQNWELALAVAEAGGLGSIPCGMLSPFAIEQEIKQFTKRSNKPYNLNFFCHHMPEPDELVEERWLDRLRKYYDELAVADVCLNRQVRTPFDEQIAEIIEPYAPPVISFHFGLPSAALVNRVKGWGTIILSSATTLEEGLWLQQNGADLVIAQGVEAGGHRAMFKTNDLTTQVGTEQLVSELVAALNIPVIAAGGLCSRDQVKRALSNGASAVQLGTVFLLCAEAGTSQLHRDALKDERSTTTITNVFSGRPARGIENRLIKDFGGITSDAPDFPYAAIAIAPLRAKSESIGRGDFTPLWSGTNRQGCREVPAKELLHSLWFG